MVQIRLPHASGDSKDEKQTLDSEIVDHVSCDESVSVVFYLGGQIATRTKGSDTYLVLPGTCSACREIGRQLCQRRRSGSNISVAGGGTEPVLPMCRKCPGVWEPGRRGSGWSLGPARTTRHQPTLERWVFCWADDILRLHVLVEVEWPKLPQTKDGCKKKKKKIRVGSLIMHLTAPVMTIWQLMSMTLWWHSFPTRCDVDFIAYAQFAWTVEGYNIK